jgi:ubiquinone/menaquinone biosynthesis C-methylase UbiE
MNKTSGIKARVIKVGTKFLSFIIYVLYTPVRKELNKETNTILDVGCGRGLGTRSITRSKKYATVGADIFFPDLVEAKKNRTHDSIVWCDARNLPFKRKSFDVVLCIAMLEHVDKEEGKRLIESLETIALKKVILSTPVGYLRTSHEKSPVLLASSNPYQEHRTGWVPDELRALGYKVYYNNILCKLEQYISHHFSDWSWLLTTIIFSFLGPLLWISPKFGVDIFCVKELDNKSRMSPAA